MRQSKLFTKTLKELPKDEVSVNAKLLTQAGFIDKLSAGIYSYLPLGLRVLNKIKQIVREEMDAIDGQEILMPALTPKAIWAKTGRWDEMNDILFKLDSGGKEYALGSTHEEVVTPLLKKFITSYKDLPVCVYQIQDKFRNEARPKSGLLRGREFSMKDLYSFHADLEDLEDYYNKSKQAYLNVFNRCGLDAKEVEASGGSFSKYSHEFQVITKYGEDIIFYCSKCDKWRNRELIAGQPDTATKGLKCDDCKTELKSEKSIEVGNIFQLKNKFSDSFGLTYTDKNGKKQTAMMGCYGIGPSRVMGSVVEVYHDDKGMIWPEAIAPFKVHLIGIKADKEAVAIYDKLQEAGIEVLYDDRDVSAGEKFADADLIGLPYRLVVSAKTAGQVEIKKRNEDKAELKSLAEVVELLKEK
jgi:prolyl-tRNA synthetase